MSDLQDDLVAFVKETVSNMEGIMAGEWKSARHLEENCAEAIETGEALLERIANAKP